MPIKSVNLYRWVLISNFYVRKLYINFTDDAVALKCVTLTLNTQFTHPVYTESFDLAFRAISAEENGLVTLKLRLVHLRVKGSQNAALIFRHGWHQEKMKKWHVEPAISGPAGSIIKGWFVRSSLVFMTSALLSLSRWTRATEDDYMSRNLQKDHTELFSATSEEFQVILVFRNQRQMVLGGFVLISETQLNRRHEQTRTKKTLKIHFSLSLHISPPHLIVLISPPGISLRKYKLTDCSSFIFPPTAYKLAFTCIQPPPEIEKHPPALNPSTSQVGTPALVPVSPSGFTFALIPSPAFF